jgi:arylsulfatase
VRSYRELVDVTYGALPNDEVVWRNNQGYYFNCVREASHKVASLFRALEVSGYADNTIVVFTSDHGEMGGAQRLRQKGPVVYRENVNVPFMVVHPDIAAPRSTDALGTAVDILPTLYAFAGGRSGELNDPLGKLPGVDLGSAISRSGGTSARDARGAFHNYAVPLYIDPEVTEAVIRHGDTPGLWAMFWEAMKLGRFGVNLHNRAFHRGVYDGRYKFARFFAPAQHHIPGDWDMLTRLNDLVLYDTKVDPFEMHNLATEGTKHKDLILALNRKTNVLIGEEIGTDDGREQPGPDFLYRL